MTEIYFEYIILKFCILFDLQSIPPWDHKKHEGGMKPLSAKEEKSIDDAIAVATELQNLNTSGETTPKTPKTPKDKPQHTPQGQEPSPKDGKKSKGSDSTDKPETLSGLKSVFGLKKRSPRTEGRVFSEEFSKSSSASREDLSPEAQEVYNVLVGQGLHRERAEDGGGAGVEHRRHVRDRRVRRSLEHQRHSGELSTSPIDVEAAKERNQKLRTPQGIPGRGAAAMRDTSAGDVDTNPLRRLRESNTFAPRVARPPSSEGPDKLSNGHNNNNLPPRSTSLDHIRRPNITAQSHFLSRVTDSEVTHSPNTYKTSQSADELATVAAGSRGEYDPHNPPVPPRKPLRPGTINTKPRERKFPLDLNGRDESTGSDQSSEPDPSSRPSTLQLRDQSRVPHSEEGGINGNGQLTEEHEQPPPPPRKSYAHLPPFAVKNVTCSATEMGIGNESDTFWSKPVDFEALSEVDSINAPPQEGGLIPIRYKSPDNVSYEDLMEFALDG